MFKTIKNDINSILAKDPAAKSFAEVLICYSGLHAVWFYRIAHKLWKHNFFIFARVISMIARFLTGIEIHPGAKIGSNFFIDHGMGVVIGETTEIGDNVTIYQSVTLGGTSLSAGKRHPTLQNNVIVGAGAKILGAFVVGEYAKIGSNAVVTKEVPAFATVVGIPGKIINQENKPTDFELYGMQKMPDPISAPVEELFEHICDLEKRIHELSLEVKKLGGRCCKEDRIINNEIIDKILDK